MKAIVGRAPMSRSARALILDKASSIELLRSSMSTKATAGTRTFTAGGKTFSTDRPSRKPGQKKR